MKQEDYAALKMQPDTIRLLAIINNFLRGYADEIKYKIDRKKIYEKTKLYVQGDYKMRDDILQGLHHRITVKFSKSDDFTEKLQVLPS